MRDVVTAADRRKQGEARGAWEDDRQLREGDASGVPTGVSDDRDLVFHEPSCERVKEILPPNPPCPDPKLNPHSSSVPPPPPRILIWRQ